MPSENVEPLDWLVASASHGYEGAFITGNQIFAAHGLPTPKIILDGPKCNHLRMELQMLEGLASHEFYAKAVRIFFTKEQRFYALDLFGSTERFEFDESFYSQKAKFVYSQGSTIFESTTEFESHFEQHRNHVLLFQAVLQEDEQALTFLIERGFNINFSGVAQGLTPLHLACRIASIALIRLLLKCGADASLQDRHGVSPIHWIILLPEDEISQIAKLLLESGADVMSCSQKPVYFDTLGLRLINTPLNWACSCRNTTAVKTLLNLGAEFGDFTKVTGLIDKGEVQTVLGLLCADILKLLITHTNRFQCSPEEQNLVWDCIGDSFTEFQHWCIHGKSYEKACAETVDLVIQAGVAFPIHRSSTTGDSDAVSPLSIAAGKFNTLLLRKYLDLGAKINERDWLSGDTALHTAIAASGWFRLKHAESALETIRALVDNEASLETECKVPKHRILEGPRMSPFLLACFISGVPVSVVRLLATRVISAINRKFCGFTPLYLSVRSSMADANYEIVRFLLDHGADPDIETDHKGVEQSCCQTAVAEALRAGSWKIAKMLLDRGCSTNVGVLGGHRRTLSHFIIINAYKPQPGYDREMESLFELCLHHPIAQNRNLVNDPDYQGYSPVAIAVFLGVPHCVKVLLEHRCNLELPEGKNIFHLLDHCLKHPPSFVVDDKYVKHNQTRKFGSPLRSNSSYRDALMMIKKMLTVEKKIDFILLSQSSNSTFPLSIGPPHGLRHEVLPTLSLGQPVVCEHKYLEIETEFIGRYGVHIPTQSASHVERWYNFGFGVFECLEKKWLY